MHVAIICLDKPDRNPVRVENRPAHLEHLKAHKAQILAAGPLLGADGASPLGSLLIMEFDTLEAARNFANADPYAKAGLFQSVDIHPWRKVFPAD